jgi:hypothetical protein
VRLLLPAFPSVQAGVTPSGPALPLPAGRDVHHHHLTATHTAWPGWVHSLPAGLGPLAHTADGTTPWLQAGHITASGQPVWLLHAPGLYEQGQHPYHDDNGHAWANSAARFAWLGWAAALLGLGLDSAWTPDVVHGHDWHTGLGLAYLHHLGAHAHLPRPATVFTIHNLAYQGVFGPEVRTPLGLPATLFHMHGLEYHGNVSFMKAGLVFSDAITTVSPTYAREITRPEQGCGLDGVLRNRQSVLHGILNGVDDTVWNPATDPLDLDVVVETEKQHTDRQAQGAIQVGGRHDAQVGMWIADRLLPQQRQEIDRKKVHRVHQKHPHEHGQGKRCDELSRFFVVHDGFSLPADHLDQDLQRCLRTPRNTGGSLAGDAPHQEQSERTKNDGKEECVKIEDRKIDDLCLRVSRRIQVAQMV